jgi:hypothetical protein
MEPAAMAVREKTQCATGVRDLQRFSKCRFRVFSSAQLVIAPALKAVPISYRSRGFRNDPLKAYCCHAICECRWMQNAAASSVLDELLVPYYAISLSRLVRNETNTCLFLVPNETNTRPAHRDSGVCPCSARNNLTFDRALGRPLQRAAG